MTKLAGEMSDDGSDVADPAGLIEMMRIGIYAFILRYVDL